MRVSARLTARIVLDTSYNLSNLKTAQLKQYFRSVWLVGLCLLMVGYVSSHTNDVRIEAWQGMACTTQLYLVKDGRHVVIERGL